MVLDLFDHMHSGDTYLAIVDGKELCGFLYRDKRRIEPWFLFVQCNNRKKSYKEEIEHLISMTVSQITIIRKSRIVLVEKVKTVF